MSNVENEIGDSPGRRRATFAALLCGAIRRGQIEHHVAIGCDPMDAERLAMGVVRDAEMRGRVACVRVVVRRRESELNAGCFGK